MKRIFLIFLLSCTFLPAINNSLDDLFWHTKIWVAPYEATLADAKKSENFKLFDTEHLNLGITHDRAVWVKIRLTNSTARSFERVLSLDNPLLEEVIFYDKKDGYIPYKSGMLHVQKNQKWIHPSYTLSLQPHESREIFIHVKNKTTTLQFALMLHAPKSLDTGDKIEQFFIVFCIGLLSAFLLYALLLFVYTKNKSYFLYSLYLATLMFQQLTYIGFLPLYAPSWFSAIDNLIVVPKVSIMIIAAALFAQSFLGIKSFAKLNKIYNLLIIILLIQMPLFGTPLLYIPEVTIFLGLLFVIFNTFAGVYVYIHGNKQARFFLAGWSFLIAGYVLMIFDSLGLISVMHHFPELILLITVLEALFLLLAFVDQIHILRDEKHLINQKLLDVLENRQSEIKREVQQRTEQLKTALDEKVILYRELNHRVKNNLQLILSIIALQRFEMRDEQSIQEFKKLENRIRSIAKTHEMLCESQDIAQVDMKEYIDALWQMTKESLVFEDSIELHTDIQAMMPLRDAVYVGIIINELISNAIKHAFSQNGGALYITLHKNAHEYILSVKDDGNTAQDTPKSDKALGLKLVYSLVEQQLDGTLKLDAKDGFYYTIHIPIKRSENE